MPTPAALPRTTFHAPSSRLTCTSRGSDSIADAPSAIAGSLPSISLTSAGSFGLPLLSFMTQRSAGEGVSTLSTEVCAGTSLVRPRHPEGMVMGTVSTALFMSSPLILPTASIGVSKMR